jgi:nifR3 family TIM-barrel protein
LAASPEGEDARRDLAQPPRAPAVRQIEGKTYPVEYWVRDVRVAPNVVLAPMEGVTDLVFRRLIRGIGGPGLTYTEFIASRGLKEGDGRMWQTASFDPEERPIALQIYGRDPGQMAEAARMLEARGATILDINMGCPSKKVCANSGGSSLLREPDHAIEIVRAVRRAIQIPLTVKMRSGFDAQSRNAPEMAYKLQEEGVEALTIHWRTRADLYGGTRAVDKIAEAVQRVKIPVVGNGDIVDLASAKAMFDDTGCAGVMIGRGAIRNPWLMLQVGQWLRGEPVTVVDAAERERGLVRYFDTIYEAFHSERGALDRMKMVTKHFTEDLPFGAGLRTRVLRSGSRAEAYEHTRAYFGLLREHEGGEPGALAASEYAQIAREFVQRKQERAERCDCD